MSFCSGCIDLKELPGAPAGKTQQIAGLDAYVAQGSKKGTILIAPDIYGLGITNPKIVADKFAEQSGYTVWAVDYFKGDPVNPKDFVLPSKASDGPPSDDVMGKNFGNFQTWMGRGHGFDETFALIKPVIAEAKKQGPVGIVGYCYGGKTAVMAAKEKLIDAFVLYHPSMVEADEAAQITVPVLINAAELDPLFGGEAKDTWFKTLKEKKLLDEASTTYPNTVHGFGARPDVNDEKVNESWKKSIAATSAFFGRVFA